MTNNLIELLAPSRNWKIGDHNQLKYVKTHNIEITGDISINNIVKNFTDISDEILTTETYEQDLSNTIFAVLSFNKNDTDFINTKFLVTFKFSYLCSVGVRERIMFTLYRNINNISQAIYYSEYLGSINSAGGFYGQFNYTHLDKLSQEEIENIVSNEINEIKYYISFKIENNHLNNNNNNISSDVLQGLINLHKSSIIIIKL